MIVCGSGLKASPATAWPTTFAEAATTLKNAARLNIFRTSRLFICFTSERAIIHPMKEKEVDRLAKGFESRAEGFRKAFIAASSDREAFLKRCKELGIVVNEPPLNNPQTS
jgi:hypothetical protein